MYVMHVMRNVTHAHTHMSQDLLYFSHSLIYIVKHWWNFPSILGLSNEVYVHITRCVNSVMVAMVTRENEYSTSLAVQLMML